MAKGIEIKLDGVFTNGGLQLPSLMPKSEFLLVDARGVTHTDNDGNVRVANKGLANDGVIEPNVTVKDGVVLASENYRGVLFEGSPKPNNDYFYSIAGHTPSLQRGGIGGFFNIITGDGGELTNAGTGARTLRTHNSAIKESEQGENPEHLEFEGTKPSQQPGSQYPIVIGRGDRSKPDLALPTIYGDEYAVVASYGAFDDGFEGRRLLAMTPDGSVMRNQGAAEGHPSDLNYQEIRMGIAEYGGFMPVSGFAAWSTKLEWDEMEQVCRVLLGLETY
ncbi:hypothetical protein R84981_001696 [Carnimonas sp. R-84981]|uniref:hypothetical protein n=1 Tax=Carnimonas bestiolae TaxID=3402172 RepID=UPI003EDB7133